jgi:acetylornithine deacetylase/succinyl-diaminopimelate desuccinylase-like protein
MRWCRLSACVLALLAARLVWPRGEPARRILKMAIPAPAVATDSHAPNDHVRIDDLVKVAHIYLRIACALLTA